MRPSRSGLSLAILAPVLVLAACAGGEFTAKDGATNEGGMDGGPAEDGSATGCQPECAVGQVCMGTTCVPGCTDDTGCPTGLSCCGGMCRNLPADIDNCGMCGNACGMGGNACRGGTCFCGAGAICGAGQVCCGGLCADLTEDPANCGECGTRCADGEACVEGACGLPPCSPVCMEGETCESGVCRCGDGPACPPGQGCCGGDCVDVNNDGANCGSCGNACEAGQVCDMGMCVTPACVPACEMGNTCCGMSCYALSGDLTHCGSCAVDCTIGRGETCSMGMCRCGGAPGCMGTPESTCCGARCANVRTDVANCGMCGRACGPGETCANGMCGCGAGPSCGGGRQCCGGACADVLNDRNNCGACGTRCSGSQQCCSGACVDTNTNTSHCGRCGNSCAGDTVDRCVAGTCSCGTRGGPCGLLGICAAGLCCTIIPPSCS